MHYFDKLAEIESQYEGLTAQLGRPEVLADPALYQKTAKSRADLTEVVEKFQQWKAINKSVKETKTLVDESSSDPEMKAMAHEELLELEKREEKVEQELRLLLLPRDPNDEKNVVLEIRAGTGGTKPRCLPRTFSACTPAMRSRSAGAWKCSRQACRAWAA